MKRFLMICLSFVFVVSLAGISYAKHDSTTDGTYATGIVGSRHNLSSSGDHIHSGGGTGTGLGSAGTTEPCVFCHTPHFGDDDNGPLWNRNGSTTYIGRETAEFGFAPATAACLSCHDGTTALDALINIPGNGKITDLNVGEGGTEDLDYLSLDESRLVIGETGTGLNNDHPITVHHNSEGHHFLRNPGTVISTVTFADGDSANGVTSNLWDVDGKIDAGASINDVLVGAGDRNGDTSGDNTVECVTCHDPHYKNQTNPDPFFVAGYDSVTKDHESDEIDGDFLRRVGGNSNSGVCRTCHWQ